MSSLFPQEPNAGYAQIAVERGIDRYPDGLTYAIPRELADLETGERVVVPLGRGSTPVAGYVVDRVLEPSMDPESVKWILRRDGSARGLPADLMGVARWVAQYYQAPLGLTVAAMLPSAVRRGVGSVKRRLLDLAPDPPGDVKPTTKQQQVLDALQSMPELERPVELLRLKDMAGIRTSGPVDRLLRDGFLLERRRTEIEAKWRTPPPGEVVPDIPALTDAQRHQQWSLAAAGEADIVLGARSAVFAPIPTDRLGLIIVDEEHDSSYKQETTPRYNGRDTAIRRGQLAGCPVLLGSATPALESWWNATRRGVSKLHRLPERAPGLVVPSVRIVDLAEERRNARRTHLLIGPTLASAINHTLEENHQVLLLLNRRGWASYVSCSSRSCGWMMKCEHCDVNMVFHRAGDLPSGGYLRCHHCNTEVRLPATCPDCSKAVVKLGLGTQRIEAELEDRWPALAEGGTLRRVDSDSMRSMQDFHEALGDFASGRIQVLLGTQMIAKGLDVPGVRLVGVIDADTAMHLPDFRAVERTYQLVSQVTGRCGRGSAGGLAIIQTFDPSSPAITMAARNDYDTFAETELADRQQMGLPPATRLARIIIRDRNRNRATEAALRIARQLQELAETDVTIRGPSTCPIARIADAWREQVEVLAPSASRLQALLSQARDRLLLEPSSRFQVDVDPQNLL
jgi:primosomal protein N'